MCIEKYKNQCRTIKINTSYASLNLFSVVKLMYSLYMSLKIWLHLYSETTALLFQ